MLPDDLYGGVEQITDSALRRDELRMRGIGFDLPAQPQYLDVDRTVIDLGVV